MPRTKNNKLPKKNATEERLRATPFTSVDELEAEERSIRLDAWRRMTSTKVFDELMTKPEMSRVSEELKAGLACSLNGSGKDQVYRIYSEGVGLKLEVNKRFADSLGEHQIRFFQGVVQAGIEGYGALILQVKGLLKRPAVDQDAESALAR